MNRFSTFLLRFAVVFSLVTTLCLGVAVATLWANGFLTETRIAAAVNGLRGESAERDPAPPRATAGDPAAAREMEGLVMIAEARERDLRLQLDRIRTEKKAAEKKTAGSAPKPEEPSPAGAAPAATKTPAGDRFQTNLQILRNHQPKTAAALMADWEKTEIVAYLRALKPYEAADILAALFALPKKGETDYAMKAREIQSELGK
ncbi:MAG: hypothetical protein HYY18_00095 [Planctomycetes bacterium]|nr:hypothetical protein [Planctomycetota bacterium]